MRKHLLCILVLLLLAGAGAAADTNRYSYLQFDRVEIALSEEQARVSVEYRIDPGIRPLVAIFGRGDLHRKVRRMMGFEDAKVLSLSLDRAELLVEAASSNYGDGSFWFPAHTFGVVVPSLAVSSPQSTREFNQTDTFPRGMGHFGVAPPAS
ncbi:MAG: hypothetical protein GXY82_08190 [Methanospirillum sp.]|nr:hypothetical protein [Methanospirillum sp.]